LVAEQVTVVPAVSAVSVVGLQPVEEAIPDSGSTTVQVTVTALLYQPLLPAVPVMVWVMTGGVLSITMLRVLVLVWGAGQGRERQLESATLTVIEKLPAEGIGPEMTPAGLTTNPAGPDTKLQVMGRMPPVAARAGDV